MSKIIQAADFGSREELDAHLLQMPSAERDISFVEGTPEEMAAKHLSNTTRVHGVPCRVIGPGFYTESAASFATRIDRGPQHDYGLEGQQPKKAPVVDPEPKKPTGGRITKSKKK